MGKKTIDLGCHLLIEPDMKGVFDPEGEAEKCREIVSYMMRHIDDIGPVKFVAKTAHVCEHCGSTWTEMYDRYNGGCCEQDEVNAPEES